MSVGASPIKRRFNVPPFLMAPRSGCAALLALRAAKPVPAKPASLFDVPAPFDDEDDPTSDEGYTSEPEESEEMDEAA